MNYFVTRKKDNRLIFVSQTVSELNEYLIQLTKRERKNIIIERKSNELNWISVLHTGSRNYNLDICNRVNSGR